MNKDKLMTLKIDLYAFSAEGILILIVNIPLVLVILVMERFRQRKEFLFIAGLAIGDLIYTIGYISSSIRRILILQNDDRMVIPKGECVRDFTNMLFHIGTGVVGEMTLFTAIDRLIATVFPVWHFKQKISYSVVMCLIPLVNSIILTAANFFFVVMFNSADQVPILCFDSTYPNFRAAFAIHRCGSVFLSALIYIAVIILLHKKTSGRFVNIHCKQLTQQQRKNVRYATTTMGLSTLNAVLLMMIPELLLYFRIFKTQSMYLILYSLILNKIMVNFILFVARHREFRLAFSNVFNSRTRTSTIQNGWCSRA